MHRVIGILGLLSAIASHSPAEVLSSTKLPEMHRRPYEAVLSADERSLFVANRRSGTLSTVDVQSGEVTERTLGQQLSAIVRRSGSIEVLAVDFAGAEVVVLNESRAGLRPVRRVAVAAWPVAAAVSTDGRRCCVASLWSRRASVVRLDRPSEPAAVVDLPFAPRAVEMLDARHAVIAEAFGGRLAVVDCDEATLLSVFELPIHNIRDLALSGDSLYLTHQILSPTARTEAEHIHWGILMQNEVSRLPVTSLLETQADLEAVRSAVSVGGPGNGAGDPQSIVVTLDRLVVSLAGTDELALIDRVGVREVRLSTGTRPVDVVLNDDRSRAFVVNELSDSVTVVDLLENEILTEIELGPTPKPGAVERGERAFFSSRLSLESWMSCHSCHTDGHTNNRLADTLGDGGYGDAKRIPSLLGVWATGPWAWNGKHSVLHSQVAASLRTTMHTRDYRLSTDAEAVDSATPDLAADLAAYLTTLSRPPSISAARLNVSVSDDALDGAVVFESRGCVACHDPFTSLTTDGVFDVGLPDRSGLRQFNPPSLGAVSQRDRLLHDGRARSLQDVLLKYSHPSGQKLPQPERRALIEYLKGL